MEIFFVTARFTEPAAFPDSDALSSVNNLSFRGS